MRKRRYSPRSAMIMIADIAAQHDLPVQALTGQTQTREVVRARHDAYERLRLAGFSYPAIGLIFNRDHSSVVHALRGRAKVNPNRFEVPVPDLSGEWAI